MHLLQTSYQALHNHKFISIRWNSSTAADGWTNTDGLLYISYRVWSITQCLHQILTGFSPSKSLNSFSRWLRSEVTITRDAVLWDAETFTCLMMHLYATEAAKSNKDNRRGSFLRLNTTNEPHSRLWNIMIIRFELLLFFFTYQSMDPGWNNIM